MTSDRRNFLKGVAGTLTGLAAIPSGSLLATGTLNESYWRQIKEQFTIKPQFIMLNAANLCPSPQIVRDRVFRLTEDLDSDVSFQNRAKFDVLREEARRKLAAFVGASEDEIAIVRNTSEGNSTIVNGLDLKPGDEVVVFDQNHPTNNVAWDVRGARLGFAVKRFSVPSPPESVDDLVKIFRSAISARTKVVAFTDVSNTTGVRMPSKELCRIAREQNIYTHVDGAQTFGALAVNLHEMGCDSYAASAHKWFMGPKEEGLLYVKQERIAQIWPSVVGVGWGNKVETSARGARKFETLGQRDDGAVSAMGTAVDFLNVIGAARVEARILELAATLKEGIAKVPRAQLRTSVRPDLSAGVCVVAFEGLDSQKIYETLYSKHSIAGAATGGVRLCPHIYNTLEEIERTISALSNVIRAL
jgi:selenocysteine lyase/cysteine desulfurase